MQRHTKRRQTAISKGGCDLKIGDKIVAIDGNIVTGNLADFIQQSGLPLKNKMVAVKVKREEVNFAEPSPRIVEL